MATAKKTQSAGQRNGNDTRDTAARGAVAAANGPALTPTEVATRAYEIWQASGRPNGRDQEHWFQAERELRGTQPSRGARR
jgi:Protein of unknown function (DUF2934)